MKKVYPFHMLSVLILLLMGGYFVYDLMYTVESSLGRETGGNWDRKTYYIKSISLSRTYGVFSLLFFFFSIFIGWKTSTVFPKTRLLHIWGGLGFFIWSILMINSSRQMNFRFEEAFLAWVIYGIIIIITNVYILLNYDKIPKMKINYDDDILDDELNEQSKGIKFL